MELLTLKADASVSLSKHTGLTQPVAQAAAAGGEHSVPVNVRVGLQNPGSWLTGS